MGNIFSVPIPDTPKPTLVIPEFVKVEELVTRRKDSVDSKVSDRSFFDDV
uniref:Uncharacterized protein n=1 Tax=viral metagenome TaxID=1070528 RepID=A0A6C0K1K0_9ZZZZ